MADQTTNSVKTGSSRNRNRNRNRKNVAEDKINEGQSQPNRERREFSNPEIKIEFTLLSQEGIRLFQRHHNNTSRALFNLNINSLKLERLGQNGAAAKTKKAIYEVFAGPEKEIASGLDTLNKMLVEGRKKTSIGEINYTAPRDYDINARTPEAARLVRIFRDFDKLVTLVDCLYLHNVISPEEADDYKDRLRISIKTMSEVLLSHAGVITDDLNSASGQNAEVGSEVAVTIEPNVDVVDSEVAIETDRKSA